jgi:tight adherence protein B
MAGIAPFVPAALVVLGTAMAIGARQFDRANRLRMTRRVEGLTRAAPLRLPSAAIEIATMRPWQTLLYRILSSEPGRGGLYVPRKGTLVLGFVFGAVTGMVSLGSLLHLRYWLVGIGSLALALVMPRLIANVERRRQSDLFIAQFPDAIDMIVRMLRAGLPVTSAFQIVGAEAPDPVGAIFGGIANEIAIGVPLEQVLARRVHAIEPAEFRYFTVAVNLQRATGGNLAETLERLAGVIRRRKNVRAKARAMIAEVQASAYVLGALPFVIGGLLFLLNPGYIGLLFVDPRGNLILGAIAGLLLLAAVTMRWMIKRGLKT